MVSALTIALIDRKAESNPAAVGDEVCIVLILPNNCIVPHDPRSDQAE